MTTFGRFLKNILNFKKRRKNPADQKVIIFSTFIVPINDTYLAFDSQISCVLFMLWLYVYFFFVEGDKTIDSQKDSTDLNLPVKYDKRHKINIQLVMDDIQKLFKNAKKERSRSKSTIGSSFFLFSLL